MISRTGVLSAPSRPAPSLPNALAALLAFVGAAVMVLAGVLAAPSTASAQNDLVDSQPADGAALDQSPDEIVLSFAEPVGNSNNVTVSCNGQPFTGLAQPVVSDDAQTITVEMRDELPSGACTVVWGVSQETGRPGAQGSFSFAVESGAPGTAPSDAGPDDTEPDEEDQPADTDAPEEPADGDETPADTDQPAETVPAAGESPEDDDEAGGEVAGDGDVAVADLGSEGSEGALWVGRLVSTLGMSMVLGALVLLAFAWPEGPEYVIAVRFIRVAWLVAAFGTVIYVAAATASVTALSFGSSLNPLEWGELADLGWPGRAALARIVLVGAMAWVVALPERVVQPSTQLPALAIPVLAVATIGLTRTDGDLAALGVVMAILHAVAMAIWLGGVIFVSRIVLAGSGGDDLVHATRGFSKLAMPALIVTVLTGLVQLVRLDGGSLFSEAHGRVLLLKSLVVAVLLFVAVAVQQVVQARLVRSRGMDLRTADRLRRAFGADAALGVIVLALTGWMLAYQPGNVDAEVVTTEPREETTALIDVIDEEANISMSIEVAPAIVGDNDIVIRVYEPEDGLSALNVTFVPPAGSSQGNIEQSVPLDGTGMAVLAPGDDGLPFEVAGTWTLEVSGSTDTGAISGQQGTFEIRNTDGSLPDSRIDRGGDGESDDDGDETDDDGAGDTDGDGTEGDGADGGDAGGDDVEQDEGEAVAAGG